MENGASEIPSQNPTKRKNVEDLLMIFTDKVTVRFTHVDGHIETLRGRWCKECK